MKLLVMNVVYTQGWIFLAAIDSLAYCPSDEVHLHRSRMCLVFSVQRSLSKLTTFYVERHDMYRI
jgi:hypothetical protein